jgi:hypothetical protein
MQENIIFRDKRNEPGSNVDLFGQPLFDVVDHMRGIGDEDEKVTPINISGEVLGSYLSTSGNEVTMAGGFIIAITHIGTISEVSSQVADDTQTDLYSVLQSMLSDDFNYKIIGKIRSGMVDKTFYGSYNFNFSKKLRAKLRQKIEDPDFNISFDIAAVVFLNETLDGGSGEYVGFSGIHRLQYQTNQRNLIDLPT